MPAAPAEPSTNSIAPVTVEIVYYDVRWNETPFEEWVKLASMTKETVTFRIDAEKRATLDRLAEKRDRDRSYLLNEAVDAYLDVHAWQIAHIAEGLRQAEAGDFADEAEVAAFHDRSR